MKVATFENMRISVPLKDDETIEIIANRLLDAIDSIGDSVIVSFTRKLKIYMDITLKDYTYMKMIFRRETND